MKKLYTIFFILTGALIFFTSNTYAQNGNQFNNGISINPGSSQTAGNFGGNVSSLIPPSGSLHAGNATPSDMILITAILHKVAHRTSYSYEQLLIKWRNGKIWIVKGRNGYHVTIVNGGVSTLVIDAL